MKVTANQGHNNRSEEMEWPWANTSDTLDLFNVTIWIRTCYPYMSREYQSGRQLCSNYNPLVSSMSISVITSPKPFPYSTAQFVLAQSL